MERALPNLANFKAERSDAEIVRAFRLRMPTTVLLSEPKGPWLPAAAACLALAVRMRPRPASPTHP